MKPKAFAAAFTAIVILTATTATAQKAPVTGGRVRPVKPPLVRPRVIPRVIKPTQQSNEPLAITSPKKYEGWGTDAKHTITWTTTLPATTRVKIELLQNDTAGTLFRTLTTNAPNTGSYEWEGISASQYNSVSRVLKVRITTLDNAHSAVSEIFTFGKPLYLHQPAAVYTWRKKSKVTIMWEVVTRLPARVSVDLLDSNHKQSLNITANQSPIPNASTNKKVPYQWTIPSTVAPGSYFVRVSSGDIAVEQAVKIEEPIVLPKSPYITIGQPSPFEGWATDAPHTIKWNSIVPADPNVKIDLVQVGANGITSWRTITADTPDTGTFQWAGIPSAQFNSVSVTLRVRVSTLDNSQVTVSDPITFGKPFYFIEPAAPYSWRKGSKGRIGWEPVAQPPEPLNIDLLNSSHNKILTIATNINRVPRLSTNKREYFDWTIPTNLAAGAYFIRISGGSISMEKPINIAD